MRKILLIAIVMLPQILLGQSYSTNRSRGRIEIKGDVAVSQLVQKHIDLNERVRTIPGYRIQIASLSGTASKNRAFEMKVQGWRRMCSYSTYGAIFRAR